MVTRRRLLEICTNVTRMAARLGVFGLLVGTIAGYFGTQAYLFDTLANFRGVYVTCALVGVVALVVTGGRKTAALAAFIAGVNLWSLLPYTELSEVHSQQVETSTACAGEAEAKVVVINALISNMRHDVIIDYVRAEDPEVLVISELHWKLGKRLQEEFPYSHWRGEKYSYEVGVFSKFPIGDVERVAAEYGSPQFVGVIHGPQGPFRLLAVHPAAPGGSRAQQDRNAAIAILAEHVRTSQIPVVLAGDLNITMWSPFYAPLEEAGLVNARRGRSVAPTFPTAMPPFRVPIDHVMHTADVGVCSFEVGESIHSDHLPLVARIALPRSTQSLAHATARR